MQWCTHGDGSGQQGEIRLALCAVCHTQDSQRRSAGGAQPTHRLSLWHLRTGTHTTQQPQTHLADLYALTPHPHGWSEATATPQIGLNRGMGVGVSGSVAPVTGPVATPAESMMTSTPVPKSVVKDTTSAWPSALRK